MYEIKEEIIGMIDTLAKAYSDVGVYKVVFDDIHNVFYFLDQSRNIIMHLTYDSAEVVVGNLNG